MVASMVLTSFTWAADTASAEDATLATAPIIVSYDFPEPIIQKSGKYDRITMGNLRNFADPGAPMLPVKGAKILLPQGRTLDTINVTGDGITLTGTYNIYPGQESVSLREIPEFTEPNATIYSSFDPYPGRLYDYVSIQGFRGYPILILSLSPVQYVPATGTISYYEHLTVNITTKPTATPNHGYRGLRKDHAAVMKMVDNPDTTNTYLDTLAAGSTEDVYEYVIITNDTLAPSFQVLCDWKSSRAAYGLEGINATVVTVDSITTNSSNWIIGDSIHNDTQGQIHKFIWNVYNNWSICYVLLGGDVECVPHRVLLWGGQVSDLYYGGLCNDTGTFVNWDDDGDGIYGERTSTIDDEADYYAEVYIGRATVDTPEQAMNFINKTIAYENKSTASSFDKALMVGYKLIDHLSYVNGPHWGGDINDIIIDEYLPPNINVFPLYHRDNTTPMFVNGVYQYNELMDKLNESGMHIVNHYGHGWWDGYYNELNEYVLSAQDIYNNLTNNESLFLIYSISCDSNDFFESDSISENFIAHKYGAFAYIGNTQGGMYPGMFIFDEEFFNMVYKNNYTHIGEALQRSKEVFVSEIGMPSIRDTYFLLNLLGDPETQLHIETPNPEIDIVARDPDHLGRYPRLSNGETWINITSDKNLSAVSANVTLPSGTSESLILTGQGMLWNGTFTVSSNGVHIVDVNGTSEDGNTSHGYCSFIGDIKPPNITVDASPDPCSGSMLIRVYTPDLPDSKVLHDDLTPPVVNLTLPDGTSQSIEMSTSSIDVIGTRGVWKARYTVPQDGTYNLNVSVTDLAGNPAEANMSFEGDVASPTLEVNVTLSPEDRLAEFSINSSEESYPGWRGEQMLTSMEHQIGVPYGQHSVRLTIDQNDDLNMIWSDDRNGEYNLFYKKTDSSGNVLISDKRLTTHATSYLATVADSQENIHILYRTTIDEYTYYKKLDRYGNTICTKQLPGELNLNFLSAAVDSLDNIHVVGTCGNINYLRLDQVGNVIVNYTQLTTSWGHVSPNIAVDSNNNLHIIWVKSFLYYTKLNGNWTPPVPGDPGDDSDPTFTLIDDLKMTFEPTAGNPVVAVDSMNCIHISWIDNRDGYSLPYYRKIDNNGNTLVNDTKLAEMELFYGCPLEGNNIALAVDSKDNLHISWCEYASFIFLYDLFYLKLDNLGNRMGAPMKLNKVAMGDLTRPNIAVDSYDNVHLAWPDSSLSPFAASSIHYRKYATSPTAKITLPSNTTRTVPLSGSGKNWSFSYPMTMDGVYEVDIRCPDAAGNTGTWSGLFGVETYAQSGSRTEEIKIQKSGVLGMSMELIGAGGLDAANLTLLTKSESDNIQPVWSPDGSKMVFASNRSGNYDIWTMNSDGSSPRQLTTNVSLDHQPAWSPDGRKIAFTSNRSGDNHDIWVMNFDGSNQMRLTTSSFTDQHPSWSPDSKELVFASDRTGNYDIWNIQNVLAVINGSEALSLIRLNNNLSAETQPSWSPDGTKITYVSDDKGSEDIWVMDSDGANQVPLTTDISADTNASWTLDSTKLMFESDRSGNRDIWEMNIDGSNKIQLTATTHNETHPHTGPDGTKFLFASDKYGDWSIFTINAEGTSEMHLTTQTGIDQNSDWKKDGSKVAYASDASGLSLDIWQMNPDGTGKTRITTDDFYAEDDPSWSPDGTKIAYMGESAFGTDIWYTDFGVTIRLTTDPAFDGQPAWSPDGTRIAFTSERSGNRDVWVMNSDGTAQTQLTTDTAADEYPCWSPNNSKIAFASDRSGSWDIWIMDADGSNEVQLTDDVYIDTMPSWSNDSQWISYSSERDGNKDIYMVDVFNLTTVRMTTDAAPDLASSWTPYQTSGTKRTFTSTSAGNNDVWLLESYPINPKLDVCDDGTDDWNYSKEYFLNQTTSDFSAKVNDYIANKTPDALGYVDVPLTFSSDSPGLLFFTADIIPARRSEETMLTSYPSNGTRPKIAVDENNNTLHTVWIDNINGFNQIFYKNSTDSGNTWSSGVNLTNDSHNPRYIDFACDGDNLAIVWEDYFLGDYPRAYLIYSEDSGGNWTEPYLLKGTTAFCGSGIPAVDVQGNETFIAYMHWAPWGPDFYLTMRVTWSGGTGFEEIIFRSPITGSEFAGIPDIAVEGSDIHVIIADTDPRWPNIYHWYSIDGGGNWSDFETVTSYYGSMVPGCISLAARADKLFLVWSDNRSGYYEIYYKEKGNSGWGDDTRLTFTNADSLYPELALNPLINVTEIINETVYGPSVGDGVSDDVFSLGYQNIIDCTMWINETDGLGNSIAWWKMTEGADYILDHTTGEVTMQWDMWADWYVHAWLNHSLDPLNRLHIVWQDERDGNEEIYYRKMDNQTNTIINDTRLSVNPARSCCPSLAIDKDGRTHVVWQDDRNGPWRIYYANNYVPGISTSSSDFSSSPVTLSGGDNATFSAKIWNNGLVAATDVNVRFYVYSTETLVGSVLIPEIPAKSFVTASVPWVAIPGNHTIRVVVDYNDVTHDGYIAEASIPIYVNYKPVPVIEVYQEIELTLKVTGRKGNTVTLQIYENSILINEISLTRTPGEPDTLTVYLNKYLSQNYEIVLVYNAPYGDQNPTWLTFKSSDKEEVFFIDFDSNVGAHQEIIVDADLLESVVQGNSQFYFDGFSSYDIDGEIISFDWNFGDNTTGTGEVVDHTYLEVGTYTVALTVTDNEGAIAMTTREVVVS
ncbi:MAG: PD40 domain-containing protein [Thermoplasmata archaeon]|nr:PD40 domain-containing protein [Thermoplasmata archaeon]